MTGLALFIYTAGMFWIGYHNGRRDGRAEGRIEGRRALRKELANR